MNIDKPKLFTNEKPESKIDFIRTEKGSVYKYLPDGTTQRFKTVEGKEFEPQSILVFIPDYESMKSTAPSDFNFEEIFGQDESEYMEKMKERAEKDGDRNYVVNSRGVRLNNNQEIAAENGPIFLTFGSGEKIDLLIAVSREPKIGYYTYDSQEHFNEGDGEWVMERHFGNKVIEIVEK